MQFPRKAAETVVSGRSRGDKPMITTKTCDLCGWNNDSTHGSCRRCGGQTEERLIRGKWRTVLTKPPTIAMTGYYNPDVVTPE
jgi:hypothetical protein